MLICEVQSVVVAWDFAEQRRLNWPAKLASYSSKLLISSSVVFVAFTSLVALLCCC